MITKNKSAVAARSTIQVSQLSLSDYYPTGAVYFYGYPSGTEDGFLNLDHPSSEEAIAARPNTCLGPTLSVVNFHASSPEVIPQSVSLALGLPELPSERVVYLPRHINHQLIGMQRNAAILQHLIASTPRATVVMAQPYAGDTFREHSLVDTHLSAWLNDKSNMNHYLPAQVLPKQYGVYESGEELKNNQNNIILPAVIKLTNSGGGDGVYICKTKVQLQRAIQAVQYIKGKVYAEQFIDCFVNYGIQFGISHDAQASAQILGVSEQIVSSEGEFLGGKISRNQSRANKHVAQIIQTLTTDTLPFIKSLGWYGVGCFDVLVTRQGDAYIIDANFRMTGMTAFHFMNRNNLIPHHALSFSAQFEGTPEDIIAALHPYITNNTLRIIALSRNNTIWKLNGCVLHKSNSQLATYARTLHEVGLQSAALQHHLR